MPSRIPIYELSAEELQKLSRGNRVEIADGELQLSRDAMEMVE